MGSISQFRLYGTFKHLSLCHFGLQHNLFHSIPEHHYFLFSFYGALFPVGHKHTSLLGLQSSRFRIVQ